MLQAAPFSSLSAQQKGPEGFPVGKTWRGTAKIDQTKSERSSTTDLHCSALVWMWHNSTHSPARCRSSPILPCHQVDKTKNIPSACWWPPPHLDQWVSPQPPTQPQGCRWLKPWARFAWQNPAAQPCWGSSWLCQTSCWLWVTMTALRAGCNILLRLKNYWQDI